MFTKDMLLIDAFRTEGINIDAMATVLADMGMHCLGCALAHGETVAEAADVHGADLKKMLEELNDIK